MLRSLTLCMCFRAYLSIYSRGFRRISHASLKDRERGYHHLLFHRDKPGLVHRMKRDSNAKEVVRQLDIADGKLAEEADALEEAKPLEGADPAPPSVAQQPLPPPRCGSEAPSQASTSNSSSEAQGPFLDQQQQQMLLRGLAAQHQMDWQRQQVAANLGLAASIGSMHASGWGSSNNHWTMPPNTLAAAQAFALGLRQQQQILQSGGAAASRSGRDPPSNQEEEESDEEEKEESVDP
jgi:hypothetical protein